MIEEKQWYSNCLIEAVKAKIRDPKYVKIIHIKAKDNEVYCPHYMWVDSRDNNIYDFHCKPYIEHWWNEYLFKGFIRVRPYKVYERWLKTRQW